MRNIILGFILIVLMSGVAVAQQAYVTTGNPTDSASGTLITAEGDDVDIFYDDSQGTGLITNDASDIVYTVGAEYGFSMWSAPSDYIVTPGDFVTHEAYYVTSEANNDDTNFSYTSYYTEEAGASDWKVQVYKDGTYHKTLTVDLVTIEGVTLENNSSLNFHYDVLVTSEVAGAPNGSSITILTTFETSSTPVALNTGYTGGNAYTYGGTSEVFGEVRDTTSAPILTLYRTYEVDAPKTYTGGTKEAVPGSIITFIMTLSNEGNASAESVIIIDKIPPDTNMAHVNTSGDTTNVNIDVATGSGGSWTVSYTTEATPNTSYEAAWTVIGALSSTGTGSWPGNSNTWLSDSAEAGAKWIKWEKASVATGEDSKTLQWGVTIR